MKLGKDMDMTTVLYTQEGIEETVKIWKEFEQARKEIKERRGEREDREDREIMWGLGGLER